MTTTLDFSLDDFDLDHLEFTEDPREGINMARLIQGDPQFEKDAALNKTVRYLGGIGLSMDNLPDEVASKGTIITIKFNDNSKDWCVFEKLDVVILAPARTRRYYADIDGERKLACGTNHAEIGVPFGWSGQICKTCPYNKKNIENENEEGCTSIISALVYLPELDHTCILELKGGSYVDAANWLNQMSLLTRSYAKQPEIQAISPGLPKVPYYFFKTTLSAGKFQQGKKSPFQSIHVPTIQKPYDWPVLTVPGVVRQKTKGIFNDAKKTWLELYSSHNPNAAFALPSAEAAATKQLTSASPALPAPAPTEGRIQVLPQAEGKHNLLPQAQQALAVNSIVIADDDAPAPSAEPKQAAFELF